MSTVRIRPTVALGVLAAAGLFAAVLPGAGASARHGATQDRDGQITRMHLVATTVKLTTNSAKQGGAGDVYAFKDTLTRHGKRVGADNCFCVAVDADRLACTGVLRLKGGSLTFTQPYRNSTQRGTGAITGGTGRYAGATGTFTAFGRRGTNPQVYDYTLRLRPGVHAASLGEARAGDGGSG